MKNVRRVFSVCALCCALAAPAMAQEPVPAAPPPAGIAHGAQAPSGPMAHAAPPLGAVPHVAQPPSGPMTHAVEPARASEFPFSFKQMGISELRNFGLSDDQIQQIGQIYQGSRSTLVDLQAGVGQGETALKSLLGNAYVDTTQTERSVDALIEARGKLGKLTTMMMVRMRQLMTLEQWQKLSDYQRRLPEPVMLSSMLSSGATPKARPVAPPGLEFPFTFGHMGDVGFAGGQIQQIQQVYQSNRNTQLDLNVDVQKREGDVKALLEGPNVDAVQAEQAVNALVEARNKLAKATTMMMVQMRQVMTQEQWQKLSELPERLLSPSAVPHSPDATTGVATAPIPHSTTSPNAAPVPHSTTNTVPHSTPNTNAPVPHATVPPQPLPPGVYRPGRDGVSAPQLIYRVDPRYTERARAAKIEGGVTLYVIVDVDGLPRDIRVARSLDPELDQKAIEAVSQWKFRPGTKDGQPVRVAATVEINFRLL